MPTVGREREVHQHAATRAEEHLQQSQPGTGAKRRIALRAYRRAPASTGFWLACYMQALARLGVAVSGAHPQRRSVCPRLARVPFALAVPCLAALACYRLTCCACLPQPFVFPQHCPDRRRLLGLTPGCYRCRCVCAFVHRRSHPSISIDHLSLSRSRPPPPLSSCVCLCGFAVSAW